MAERVPTAIILQFRSPDGALLSNVIVTALSAEERERVADLLSDEGFNPDAVIRQGAVGAEDIESDIMRRIRGHRRAGDTQISVRR
jgi:hypothetical protein